MALDLRAGELEHQFIQDRISAVEDNFSELCTQFSKYVKRTGQLRDNADELAKLILKISSKEILNHSLRGALARFSDILSAIQDYRDAEVQRLDHKIILPLSSYGQLCKHAKEDLKKSFSARTRELNKKYHLEKTRGKKPTNWQQISQAEHEAEKARDESTLATQRLAQKIDSFERRKLEDIKAMFLEFVNIELLFHCKAVEMYTNAYSVIKDIKIDEDLQVFRDRFKSPCSIGEVNLPAQAAEIVIASEAGAAKNMEVLPLKAIDTMDETTTTLSSCTEVSYESTTSDSLSEAKVPTTDVDMSKFFRWKY